MILDAINVTHQSPTNNHNVTALRDYKTTQNHVKFCPACILIAHKIRLSELSRRIKDYLPQETAQRSLRFVIVHPVRRTSFEHACNHFDSRTHVRRRSIRISRRILADPHIPCMIILAGVYLFISALVDRWFARIWRARYRMTIYGIEMRGPVRHFARLTGLR